MLIRKDLAVADALSRSPIPGTAEIDTLTSDDIEAHVYSVTSAWPISDQRTAVRHHPVQRTAGTGSRRQEPDLGDKRDDR